MLVIIEMLLFCVRDTHRSLITSKKTMISIARRQKQQLNKQTLLHTLSCFSASSSLTRLWSALIFYNHNRLETNRHVESHDTRGRCSVYTYINRWNIRFHIVSISIRLCSFLFIDRLEGRYERAHQGSFLKKTQRQCFMPRKMRIM